MIKQKKVLAFVLILFSSNVFVSGISLASADNQSINSEYLKEISAVPMTSQEMSQVQGEGWISKTIIKAVLKLASKELSKKNQKTLEKILIPGASSADIRRAAPGLYGWILDHLPALLRPNICQ